MILGHNLPQNLWPFEFHDTVIMSQVQRSTMFMAVGGASSVPGCDLREKLKIDSAGFDCSVSLYVCSCTFVATLVVW